MEDKEGFDGGGQEESFCGEVEGMAKVVRCKEIMTKSVGSIESSGWSVWENNEFESDGGVDDGFLSGQTKLPEGIVGIQWNQEDAVRPMCLGWPWRRRRARVNPFLLLVITKIILIIMFSIHPH